jgi:hypothetical protein
MDMHNNNVGLAIGQELGQNASVDDVIAACDNALKDGKLIWIENNKLTAPAVFKLPAGQEAKVVGLNSYLRPTFKEVQTDLTGKITCHGFAI